MSELTLLRNKIKKYDTLTRRMFEVLYDNSNIFSKGFYRHKDDYYQLSDNDFKKFMDVINKMIQKEKTKKEKNKEIDLIVKNPIYRSEKFRMLSYFQDNNDIDNKLSALAEKFYGEQNRLEFLELFKEVILATRSCEKAYKKEANKVSEKNSSDSFEPTKPILTEEEKFDKKTNYIMNTLLDFKLRTEKKGLGRKNPITSSDIKKIIKISEELPNHLFKMLEYGFIPYQTSTSDVVIESTGVKLVEREILQLYSETIECAKKYLEGLSSEKRKKILGDKTSLGSPDFVPEKLIRTETNKMVIEKFSPTYVYINHMIESFGKLMSEEELYGIFNSLHESEMRHTSLCLEEIDEEMKQKENLSGKLSDSDVKAFSIKKAEIIERRDNKLEAIKKDFIFAVCYVNGVFDVSSLEERKQILNKETERLNNKYFKVNASSNKTFEEAKEDFKKSSNLEKAFEEKYEKYIGDMESAVIEGIKNNPSGGIKR